MDDGSAREEIRSTLEQGLPTEAFPRADTPDQVQAIVARLQATGDLKEKLAVSGFTLRTIEYQGIEQSCESCMYFLVHRHFCDLPELKVPVEPSWSCRLWRI